MAFKSTFTVIAMCLCICSCAINVSPSAFFYQDTKQQSLDTTKLHVAIGQDKTTANITRAELTNAQGLTLRGVSVSYSEPMVNVLFFADNRMSISDNNNLLHRLGKLPANVLWFDYQGVGASERASKLSINAIKQDALIQFDYIKRIFDNALPTIVHGRGIGSYFASYVAANRSIDALVLDGAFNNISDLIANMVPGFSNAITNMRLHDEVHSMQIAPILRHYDGPLWLVVGEQDKITPYPISQQLLATSSSESKRISIIPGATHSATLKSDYAVSEYRRFLASLRH